MILRAEIAKRVRRIEITFDVLKIVQYTVQIVRNALTVFDEFAALGGSMKRNNLHTPLEVFGASRRDVLRLLGNAGAIGALQLLNAKEAGADNESKNVGVLVGR
jgi:hypothetical protein